jgi:hypothetical protein
MDNIGMMATAVARGLRDDRQGAAAASLLPGGEVEGLTDLFWEQAKEVENSMGRCVVLGYK